MNEDSNDAIRSAASDPATKQAPESKEEAEGLTFFQMVGSTLAAALGVQSSKNRERDFTKGKAIHFIIAGVLFTTLFVFAVLTVVNLVLPDS